MNRISQWGSMGIAAASIAFAAAGAARGVEVSVLEDAANHTIIRYAFGDCSRESIRIDGEPYTVWRLAGESLKQEVGQPALPDVSRSIIIPNDARMEVRVLQTRSYQITDVDIAPSRGPILRSVNPDDVPYTFGAACETDAFFPGDVATLGQPYILRDHRGLTVTVSPVQYNPVQRTLRVYTSMTIEIVAVGEGRINVLQPAVQAKRPVRSFDDLYRAHFINYRPDGRYEPLDEEGDMLIICHDPWVPLLQGFVDHKMAVGINTTLVTVSEAGGSAAQIKDSIQVVYDTSDLSFVLLVGDAAQVPPLYSSGGASDASFAKLAGADDYPEIMVGRFSAEDEDDVMTQVERTIEYEEMPATETDWFWKGMGIASNQGPGDDGELDYEHVDNIRELLLAYGYTEVDQIYDPYGTAEMVSEGLNAGRGIITYTGHGGPTGWGSSGFSNSHVNALVNDNMLPFITSVACNTGEFDDYTCFGEAWLRATHGDEPTGGIGFYGSTVGQYWDEPMQMQDEFADLYTTESYVCWGTLCYAGSCSMMDEYGTSGVDMFDTWVIFGDPSLRIVGTAAPPEGLKVKPAGALMAEGPFGGPFEPDSIIYTLFNYEPIPIEYSVSKTQSWVDLSSTGGTIPVEGSVEVTVSINSEAVSMPIGIHEDTVEFVNETNHKGDCTRMVSLEIGVPVPVYVFQFDEDPGWTMSGEWAFGQPTGQGGDSFGNPDPTGGATGENVYGINLNGDYSDSVGPWMHLTTTAIDCSAMYDVELHFQRWLNSDYQPFVFQTIEVSNDGTTWEDVWDNGSSEMAESSWSEQVYDLSDVADFQETVYLRWGHKVDSGGAYAYSGWNIDDVAIWGVNPMPDCPCDCTGDGVVDVLDLMAVLAAWGDSGTLPEDVTGDGTVDVMDLMAVLADWGPC